MVQGSEPIPQKYSEFRITNSYCKNLPFTPIKTNMLSMLSERILYKYYNNNDNSNNNNNNNNNNKNTI